MADVVAAMFYPGRPIRWRAGLGGGGISVRPAGATEFDFLTKAAGRRRYALPGTVAGFATLRC